ncbi:hypothetical protein LRS12_16700 [Sphingomonas sp. J344]|uniref:hypothetical protein n=1 Tax=Sphingomonas sp. J344 TaxID=2898434 RepID=UPI0021510497|nr:hypothetical protein [Sphingomonas sp. J344]MCR5872198.1 hypothetical protein [Sphingomonas sp. J344]
MRAADTLDQLVHAAIDAGIPAIHLIREGDGVRILVRTVSGLAPVHSLVASPDWLDSAQALPHATRRGDRVVIDLARHGSGGGGFAQLGMPGSMRAAFERETAAPGGVILIAAEDTSAMAASMAASVHAPGERHIVEISGDRADLDAAAHMDCDAILIRAGGRSHAALRRL